MTRSLGARKAVTIRSIEHESERVSPALQLETLFVLNEQGRILFTREPDPQPGPRFCLIRGATDCSWAVHVDVPEATAAELNALAQEEPLVIDFQKPPMHADRYLSLLGGQVESGPSFTFPDSLPQREDVVQIDGLALLQANFRGWTADEIPGRSPFMAIVEVEHAVSVCFCARRSDVAAEAGLETAEAYRGRGLATLVTAAWASAIRASGRIPLYSTSWENAASLAVTRKLGLVPYASTWSLSR